MRQEIVAIACTDASGAPTVVFFEARVSQEDYDEGVHYDHAIEKAMDEGFEAPFIPFDNSEHEALVAAGTVITRLRQEGFIVK